MGSATIQQLKYANKEEIRLVIVVGQTIGNLLGVRLPQSSSTNGPALRNWCKSLEHTGTGCDMGGNCSLIVFHLWYHTPVYGK